MKLFAVAVIFAVALQGSVYARPEPLGLSDILSVLGVPQNSNTANTLASLIPAVTNTIAASVPATTTTAAAASPNFLESAFSFFAEGFGKVFNMIPMPRASSNNIFGIVNSFLATIQQSKDVAENPAAHSLITLFSTFVDALDTASGDPISAALNTAASTGESLVKSAIEVVPTFVTSVLFGSSAQSRDIYSFSLDVAAGLNGFVAGIQQWIVSTFNLATGSVAYMFSGLNVAINSFPIIVQNVTSIGTTEGGLDALFDIAMQIVAAADLIVDEADKVISTIADTIITSADGTIEGITQAVLGYVNPAIYSVVANLSPKCGNTTTATLTNISMGMANTVEICARSETHTWTNILDVTSTALESTNVVLSGLKGVFDSLLRFDIWGFFNNAWAIMGNVASTATSYSLIVPLATEAVANVQTRFPTCMGTQTGLVFLNAIPVASNLFTCL